MKPLYSLTYRGIESLKRVFESLSLRHETITGKGIQKFNPRETPRILSNITTFWLSFWRRNHLTIEQRNVLSISTNVLQNFST